MSIIEPLESVVSSTAPALGSGGEPAASQPARWLGETKRGLPVTSRTRPLREPSKESQTWRLRGTSTLHSLCSTAAADPGQAFVAQPGT